MSRMPPVVRGALLLLLQRLPAPHRRPRTVVGVKEKLELHLSSSPGRLRAYAGFLGGVAVLSAFTIPWVVISAVEGDISVLRASLLVGVLAVWALSAALVATWCVITDVTLHRDASHIKDVEDEDVSEMMRTWRAAWPQADAALTTLDSSGAAVDPDATEPPAD